MAQITYADKVALNVNPEIAAINKVQDTDMNEIKQVVNDNYNNTIQITNTEPTDSDNKIWIDTGEIGSQASEITNEYSTSTGLGYSCNYINNNVGVVESGSNTNGNYIKYADGTMICYQRQFFSNYQITETQGVLYTATLTPNDYPVAFVGNLPIISRSIESTTWTVFGFGADNNVNASLTNPGSFMLFRGSSTGTGIANTVVNTIAIGRWK